MSRLVTLTLIVLAALVPATGPAAGQAASAEAPAVSATQREAGLALPPAGVDWDYQIGGAFEPAASVGVVSRDREAAPSPGDYNICYVNAFQTQPNEARFWRSQSRRWALVLKDADGRPVVDGRWGEFVLDTRTTGTRSRLVRIVGRWIDGCAADGFDAAEFDNLDSWYRGKGLIEKRHNKAFARLLTARAHRAGLAAGQKNWSEIAGRGPGLGFDFAVAEQCGQYDECQPYAEAYADRVFVVEYGDAGYARACETWGAQLSVVRRDVDVSPGGINSRC